jgi:hypothetical protein
MKDSEKILEKRDFSQLISRYINQKHFFCYKKKLENPKIMIPRENLKLFFLKNMRSEEKFDF